MKTNLILILMSLSLTIFSQVKSSKENQFAFNLMNKLANNDSNVFFSPYSLSSALAMTYNGANGKTKDQIERVMYFNDDVSKSNEFFFKSNSKYNSYSNIPEFKLNIGNALWINNSIKLKGKFSKSMEKYFGAELYNEINADKINTWADKNTNHMIKEIVSESDVAQSILVLTNAIYFYGEWVHKFDTTKTKKENFTTAKNEVISVDMMHQTDKILYYDNREFKMLRLPYEGERIEMTILLPQEGYSINSILENINIKKFDDYYKMAQIRKLKFALPKFKIETTYKLKDVLKDMGMSLPFTPDADFSLITKEGLFIDEVIHKAVLDISEKGTEAAAVSAIVMRTTSANTTNFIADHPFIVIIRDIKTGNILFMGTIVNPVNEVADNKKIHIKDVKVMERQK